MLGRMLLGSIEGIAIFSLSMEINVCGWSILLFFLSRLVVMSTGWFVYYDIFFCRYLRKRHHSVRSTMKWLGMMRRKMSVMLLS